jgi:cobalt-zinc-cadmium resistance protein CzcA
VRSATAALGIAGSGTDDDDDIVEGIVLMRRGASRCRPSPVKAEVDKINASGMLPPGVHLAVYDRSNLIDVTTHTVMENLVVGILLIFALQWGCWAICAAR